MTTPVSPFRADGEQLSDEELEFYGYDTEDEDETWLNRVPGPPGPAEDAEPPAAPGEAEEFDFGESEAELEAGHPVTSEVPVPTGVLEALSHGLTSVAIGLAAAAGYRDENQLTNLVFYFRHPDLVGHRIQPGERALSKEWLTIRDRVVRPALAPPAHAPTPAAPPPPSGTELSSAKLQWPEASADQLAFMRAVYDAHAAHSKASGRPFVSDLPKSALGTVDGHEARRDAAAAAAQLLEEARAAAAADPTAAGARIGIVSAYRPATLQFEIWQGRMFDGTKRSGGFPAYYDKAIQEGTIRAGDFSPHAVETFARYLGRFIASPGYSNHQDGLAFDFGTAEAGKPLNSIGWHSWFRHWLEQNGQRLHFVPLESEAWHWTYTPPAQHEYEAAAPAAIHAGRLEIAHVPLLARHRGAGPDLVLRWNEMTGVPEELDVVVHLHGFWYPRLSLTRDIEPVSGLDLSPPAGEPGSGRSRPTLTVLPRGHDTGVKQPHGPYDAYTFPALVTKTGLPSLVDYALGQFAAANGGSTPRVGRLVLTAHSGGGLALVEILQHHDPHQVHVFDALYWSPDPLIAWALRRIRQDRASMRESMGTSAGALRVFYQGRLRGGTRPNSLRVLRAIAGELGDGLERRYRVEASGYDHFQIPRRYGWRLLADVSADVPEAHTEQRASETSDEDEEVAYGLLEHDTPPDAGSTPVAVAEPFPATPFAITFGSTIGGIGAVTGDPKLRGLCAALVDLTDDPATPPFVGVNEDEVVYPGSLQKISAMYAAFQLRERVQAQVDAAGAATALADLEREWGPKLHTAFPALPERLPKLGTIVELTSAGKVVFPRDHTDAYLATEVGIHDTPQGRFGDWLVSMIRWSNNEAAGKCIDALGFPYINGALRAGGFFAGTPEHGLWLSGSYAGHDWLPHPHGRPHENPAGQPLTKRWAAKEGRVKSNMTATALQVCRLLTLLARRELVSQDASDEMKELMDKSRGGTRSFLGEALGSSRSPDHLWSKIGIGDSIGAHPASYHDCGIVERTITTAGGPKTIRYVVVGLGSLESTQSDLDLLFRTLDGLIVAAHP